MRIELDDKAAVIAFSLLIFGIIPLCMWADACGKNGVSRVQEACVYMTGNPNCEKKP